MPDPRRGTLVTIDGPSAVGKSTACRGLAAVLREQGRSVRATTTPSTSSIGNLARHATEIYSGYALSCMVAADRFHHWESHVRPALVEGDTVVCDRHTPSALALDRLEGVPREYVEHLYAPLPPPDVAFILLADPLTCAYRAASRPARSRFHRADVAHHQAERRLFDEAVEHLLAKSYPLVVVPTDGLTRDQVVADLTVKMAERLEGAP